jgi:hypothetical protein
MLSSPDSMGSLKKEAAAEGACGLCQIQWRRLSVSDIAVFVVVLFAALRERQQEKETGTETETETGQQ